jgi:pimeloyl-ACP methyl ester carboxylesterase
LAIASLFCASAGCTPAYEDHHENDEYGMVFYLDGAGGGHALSPWALGVRQGLTAGGFPGDVYMFPWNTGLGATADESVGVDYKRREARKLAGLIRRYQDGHPGRPVTLIGFSAGTAIAVFALEELPRSRQVDDVVLLGSALSRHYDLTEALRRVKNRLVVYTSSEDVVLLGFVALTGTADREFCGACAAGLRGFDRSAAPSDPETTAQYRKVEHIPWRPEFALAGNDGGHADWVLPRFIQEYVAPILRSSAPPGVADPAAGLTSEGPPPDPAAKDVPAN